MLYRIAADTEESVCVVHVFRAKYFRVFLSLWVGRGKAVEIHFYLLAIFDVAMMTIDVVNYLFLSQ